MPRQHSSNAPTFKALIADHFEYVLPPPDSHSRRLWTQVNVCAETAPEAHFILVSGDLQQVSLPGLYCASMIFDPSRLTIELVAKGAGA